MKHLPLLLLLLLLANCVNAQNSPVVTMGGIGDFKVGMTKDQVEKLTGSPLKLVRLLKEEDWERDTLEIVYKNVPYQIIMDKDYMNEKSTGFIVYEIKSNGPTLKTKSGISIGDHKLRIISAYEGYMIYILPEYENDYKTKSKTRSTVWLHGDDGKLIVFYLNNNKVTGFSVMFDEGC
ncbi:MAG: hypothetical protein ACXWB9_08025 [Flavisolibacter sp.]